MINETEFFLFGIFSDRDAIFKSNLLPDIEASVTCNIFWMCDE